MIDPQGVPVLRVLLVEDDPGQSRLITEIFEMYGSTMTLAVAGTVQAGIERLATTDVDVVLLDLSLPDSEGAETVRRMSASMRQIPVIILTGLDDTQIAIQAIRDGAQEYLIKGRMDGELLIRTIRHAIERHRLIQTLDERAKALQTSETNFRNILSRLTDAMVIVDTEGPSAISTVPVNGCSMSRQIRSSDRNSVIRSRVTILSRSKSYGTVRWPPSPKCEPWKSNGKERPLF